MKLNLFPLLYKSFKAWYDWYRPYSEGKRSTNRAIYILIVFIFFVLIGVWDTVNYIFLKNEFFLVKNGLGAQKVIMIIFIFLSVYVVLKKIVRDQFFFNEETGLSERYIFKSTQKHRKINIGLFAFVLLYDILLTCYLHSTAI